jgi:hypothetical protein
MTFRKKLVLATQVKLWERTYAELGRDIDKIQERRDAIKAMIDGAKALPRDDDGRTERAPVRKRRRTSRPRTVTKTHVDVRPQKQAATAQASKSKRPERSEWKRTIRELTLASTAPLPYGELRQKINATPLAERLAQSEKGFYHAISKLSKAGDIVAYKGHVFAPALFEKFQQDLRSGRVLDLKIPNAAHNSPMGDAIKEMMCKRPTGATSGNMIWELRKNPEFAAVIDRNKTHPYNVIRRLYDRGVLQKRGKRYYYVENKLTGAVENPQLPLPNANGGVA